MAENLVLNGVAIGEEALARARLELDALEALSPYGAVLLCELRREHPERLGYFATLDVACQVGAFHSSCVNSDASLALDTLCADLREKLKAWKRERWSTSPGGMDQTCRVHFAQRDPDHPPSRARPPLRAA